MRLPGTYQFGRHIWIKSYQRWWVPNSVLYCCFSYLHVKWCAKSAIIITSLVLPAKITIKQWKAHFATKTATRHKITLCTPVWGRNGSFSLFIFSQDPMFNNSSVLPRYSWLIWILQNQIVHLQPTWSQYASFWFYFISTNIEARIKNKDISLWSRLYPSIKLIELNAVAYWLVFHKTTIIL